LSKIKSKQPEALYLVSHPADAVIALKKIDELYLKVPVVGSDSMKDDSIISGAGKAAEGLVVTLPGVPKSAELEKFSAAYKAKYGREYEAYTPEAYDVVYILARACASTDCTSTAMKDFLYTMGEYKGASGVYAFDKDGEVQKPYDYFVIKDGKYESYVVS
jgi:branched-chain amino acid transport system substrate-binding protein